MLFPVEDIEDLENLNELVLLQNQVKAVGFRDKLGKQNFHGELKKVFESVTKSLENTFQEKTKTKTETSLKNNQALKSFNNKLLEKINDRGKLASYLMSPLLKITNPENTTQFKLAKDANWNRVKDFKINKSKSVTLYNNVLPFRDTGGKFELKEDHLQMITNKNSYVNFAKISGK